MTANGVALLLCGIVGLLLLAAAGAEIVDVVRADRARRRARLERTLIELRLQQLTQQALAQLMAEARQRMTYNGQRAP